MNLFSRWLAQSEDEQRKIYDAIGLGEFTVVEPSDFEEARAMPFSLAKLYQLPKL